MNFEEWDEVLDCVYLYNILPNNLMGRKLRIGKYSLKNTQ